MALAVWIALCGCDIERTSLLGEGCPAPGDPLPRRAAMRIDPHGLPLDDAGTADPETSARVGRATRRLDLAQLRASLARAFGETWTGPRTVRTPDAPTGQRFEPEADLLRFNASALGEADYVRSTTQDLTASVPFAKLTSDAVRAVCAQAVRRDALRPRAERVVLLEVDPGDTLDDAPTRVRANVEALGLKLWAQEFSPAEVDDLLGLFRLALTAPGGTPLTAWRAVCVRMGTDPRFLSY